MTAATYAREIEKKWSELAARPVVLSPRDWARISDWYARRIPLELVREAMDEVASRQRKGPPLRTLNAVERAVEEAWTTVRDGRVGAAAPAEEEGTSAPEEAWRERREREPAGSELGELLGAFLRRLDRGEERAGLDEELDRRLPDVAPAELLVAIRREVEREIGEYRSRMSPERFADTLRHGCLDRLRRRLDLPRLSGPGERR